MLMISLTAQCLFLLAALIVSAWLTVRKRSILMGGLCLYGLFVLWAALSWVAGAVLVIGGVDTPEIVQAFPQESGALPVVLLSWIPAFVVTALVHLVHAAFTGTLDVSPLWASCHWLIRLARRVHLLPGDASTHPGKPVVYRKWVGVVLGFLLAGSAHFLSGRRRAGVAWYLSRLALGCLILCLSVIPGARTYVAAVAVTGVALVVWLIMLKQSYRPVCRIGVLGWVAVIAINFSLQTAERWSARFMVEAFRISSQAMQPTLEGVHGRDLADGEAPHSSLIGMLVRGERYVRWQARASGRLEGPSYLPNASSQFCEYWVGRDARWLPWHVNLRFRPGEHIDKGALLWSGFEVSSDRMIVEKVSYLFRNPRRGEIVVFKTRDSARWENNVYHVFRVVGLPGERVRIEPPWLVIDGERVVDPPIFATIAAKEQGYAGFSLARPGDRHAYKPSEEVVLGAGEYFVLGDGENASDSRYCGPIPGKAIVGRVTRIYWPLNRVNALDGKW